jgi:3-dehydroquinate dehydratase-2
MKKRKGFVLNGPNLNLLGKREPEVYGTESLSGLLTMLRRRAKENRIVLRTYQSNHE